MPSFKEKVSVVLGSYNRHEYLKCTIESIRDNGIELPYEIIVVEAGSEDGALEWLVEQKDIITVVQYNRGEDIQGRKIGRRSWGYFMNLGFRIAEGKYVLMVSDDCLLLPDAINNGLRDYRRLEKMGRPVGGVAFYFRNWPQEAQYYVQRTLGGNLMINHGIFSKSALEYVGYADEDTYDFYKADGDLSLRLWQAGFRIGHAPDSFVEHYMNTEELVRAANNATLDRDRETYREMWGDVKCFEKSKSRQGCVMAQFSDSRSLAEKYWKGMK